MHALHSTVGAVLGYYLRAMSEHPPEPPNLRPEDIAAVIGWLHGTAAWLREDQAVAATHGHVASPEAENVLRLYEDAALLFREAYGSA